MGWKPLRISAVGNFHSNPIGDGNYTATGGDSQVTLSVGGLISAVTTESVSLDYGFNLSFTGSKSAVVPAPGGNNIPFTATPTLNWSCAKLGDTLAVSIPTNFIDLAVVPEPSSMLLLSLGGLFLVRRQR